MYLYRCRILYSKAVMDFYSTNFYQLDEKAVNLPYGEIYKNFCKRYNIKNRFVVKVETKHGVDLAIFLNKITKLEDKEFDEIMNIQASTQEEYIENIEINADELNVDRLNNFNTNKMNCACDNQACLKGKQEDKYGFSKNIDKKTENKKENNFDNNEKIKKRYIKIEGKFLGVANDQDLKLYEENDDKTKETFGIFKEEIKNSNLEHEMKPVGVHYFLDGNKILFDFVADHRIDFRELVKKLAARYKKRIELHQIGVRDEARMIDGIFICGQQLCCRRFLHHLNPISIKMAEVQNAPLNTMKISGYCGRLLCCLAYESQQYEKTKENLPEVGSEVFWNNEKYIVAEINVIKEYVKLKKIDSIEYLLLKNESILISIDEQGNKIINKAEYYNK